MKTINNIDEINLKLKEFCLDYLFINEGGCGFIALIIGEELMKLGFQIKYLILDDTYEETDALRKAFKSLYPYASVGDLNAHGLYIGHVLILVNDIYYIDATGITTSFEDNRWSFLNIFGTATHEKLIEWVDEEDVWNEEFEFFHGAEKEEIENKMRNIIKDLDIKEKCLIFDV